MHVLKRNPVFLYTVIGPELGISPGKNKAAIDTEVGAGSTCQTCNQWWKLLGKQKRKWIMTVHKFRMCPV